MTAAVASSPPLHPDRLRHLTFVMCGVLTTSQASAAARELGFTDPLDQADGQRAVRRIQLCCLNHIRQFYATRKNRILGVV
jgi:hypothetical protein